MGMTRDRVAGEFVLYEVSMTLDRTEIGRYPTLEDATDHCDATYDMFFIHVEGDRGADFITTDGNQYSIDRDDGGERLAA